MKTITIGIPIQTDSEISAIDQNLTETFPLRSLTGHNSELPANFLIILGALSRGDRRAFNAPEII